jgi:hypothetical protein
MLNKKGAGDGLSWFMGTIVVFLIVIIFTVFYLATGSVKRVSVETAELGENYYDNLFSQRVSGYLVNYDIDDLEKGRFPYYVHFKDDKGKIGMTILMEEFNGANPTKKVMPIFGGDYDGFFSLRGEYLFNVNGVEIIPSGENSLRMGEKIIEMPLDILKSPVYFFPSGKVGTAKFRLNIVEVKK